MMEQSRYWTSHGTGSRWGSQAPARRAAPLRHQHPAPASNDDARVAELLAQARAWVHRVEQLAARGHSPQPPEEDRPQSPEENLAIRLKCMRLAWEKRGMAWDEARARVMLADLATRGEIRTTRWPVP
jgi:hypothetical protein